MSCSSRIEDAIGAVDGVNRDFSVSLGYVPGSVEVFRNGALDRSQDDDGWVEVPPRGIQLKVAPLVDDKITVWYRY